MTSTNYFGKMISTLRSVVPLAMFYMINITTYQYFIYFTSPRDEEGSSLFQCEGVKSFTQFRWNPKRKTKRRYRSKNILLEN